MGVRSYYMYREGTSVLFNASAWYRILALHRAYTTAGRIPRRIIPWAEQPGGWRKKIAKVFAELSKVYPEQSLSLLKTRNPHKDPQFSSYIRRQR